MSSPQDKTAYTWADKECTLQEIYKANKFPVVAKVIGGYCGDSDRETVSSDDVLLLTSRGIHKKVLAHDEGNLEQHIHYYSIPHDFPIPFTKLKHNRSKLLSKLLEKESLPVKVQMVMTKGSSFTLGSSSKERTLGALELQEVYEEKYLKAKFIVKGEVYGEPVVVPTYLSQVRLVLAQGLTGQSSTPQKWQDKLQQWASDTDDDEEDLNHNTEIMVFSKDKVRAANNRYDSVEPCNYLSLSSVPTVLVSTYTQTVPAHPHTHINMVRDIPSDIRTLTCDHIVQCLRLLNMDEYSGVFQEHQVNGSLLYGLDETILMQSLGLSPIHARKLLMFSRDGWRPDDTQQGLKQQHCQACNTEL